MTDHTDCGLDCAACDAGFREVGEVVERHPIATPEAPAHCPWWCAKSLHEEGVMAAALKARHHIEYQAAFCCEDCCRYDRQLHPAPQPTATPPAEPEPPLSEPLGGGSGVAPAYGDLLLKQSRRQNDALERIAAAVEKMLPEESSHCRHGIDRMGDVCVICEGEECKGSNLCTACRTFVCSGCNLLRPWCMGADDDHGELCDDCAAAIPEPGDGPAPPAGPGP